MGKILRAWLRVGEISFISALLHASVKGVIWGWSCWPKFSRSCFKSLWFLRGFKRLPLGRGPLPASSRFQPPLQPSSDNVQRWVFKKTPRNPCVLTILFCLGLLLLADFFSLYPQHMLLFGLLSASLAQLDPDTNRPSRGELPFSFLAGCKHPGAPGISRL